MEKFGAQKFNKPRTFEFQDRINQMQKYAENVFRSVKSLPFDPRAAAEDVVYDAIARFLKRDEEGQLLDVREREAYFVTMVKRGVIDYLRFNMRYQLTDEADISPKVIGPIGGSSHMLVTPEDIDTVLDAEKVFNHTFDPLVRPAIETAAALRYYDDLTALLMVLEGNDSMTIAKTIYRDRDFSDRDEAIKARNALDKRLERVRPRLLKEVAEDLGIEYNKTGESIAMHSGKRTKGGNAAEQLAA